MSAAVFESDIGMRFYLNGTSLVAPSASNFVWVPELGGDDIYQGIFQQKKKKKEWLLIYWGLTLYPAWAPVNINAKPSVPNDGPFLDEDGYIILNYYDFTGWLGK